MTSGELPGPLFHSAAASQVDGTVMLASLQRADQWLNSPSLTPSALRGKVVLVQFWTYTCVNWRRTLPYIRAWADKYKGQGLVVIGVHTPEFVFEKNIANIRWAVNDMAIGYPVAVDSSHVIWDSFQNEYWPALYFIDAAGHLRHQQFGEGSYAQSEMTIQKLLREAGAIGVSDKPVSVAASGLEVAADWDDLQSPESYLGFEHTPNFASPGRIAFDEPRVYESPGRLRLNEWALAGDWTVRKGAVVLNKAGGQIVYRFHARDLNLVMGPATSGAPVRFRVLLNGQPPGASHGDDVDESGVGTVKEQRLYQLIRQPKPIIDQEFKIEFLGPNIAAFDFTFG
ncbi:MAG TPA: redoxin domain-containing protein [Acetobacteraceae bacterium]|nr:redoxin domain-containing protein [Acetobacteraceae bacterium]